MKKIVSLLLVGLLVSGSVFAGETEKTPKNMAITWNPLSLLGLTLAGSYGIALGDKLALIIPMELMYVGTSITYGNNSSSAYLLGLSSGVGARFYLSGKTFENGLYAQPTLELGWVKFGNSGVNSLLVGASGMVGYSWVFDSGFMMNLAAGIRYVYLTTDTNAKSGIFKIHGILPAAEFAIGYTW